MCLVIVSLCSHVSKRAFVFFLMAYAVSLLTSFTERTEKEALNVIVSSGAKACLKRYCVRCVYRKSYMENRSNYYPRIDRVEEGKRKEEESWKEVGTENQPLGCESPSFF